MTKKLISYQFLIRVNPDKIVDFRQSKGQITLMRNLGSTPYPVAENADFKTSRSESLILCQKFF